MRYLYFRKPLIALLAIVSLGAASCRNEKGGYTCHCIVTNGTPPDACTTTSDYEYYDQSFMEAELNCTIQAEITRKLSGKNTTVTCGL